MCMASWTSASIKVFALCNCFVENWQHKELCEDSRTYHDTIATFCLHCTVPSCVCDRLQATVILVFIRDTSMIANILL